MLFRSFQSFGFYYEATEAPLESDVNELQDNIRQALTNSKDTETDWELIYSALQLTQILSEKFPQRLLAGSTQQMWQSVRTCLTYPHAWVKLAAAKLMGTYFVDFARANVESGLSKLPLKGTNGLTLGSDDIRDLIRRTAHMFKTPSLTEPLAAEIVKNLNFLGRVSAASGLSWKAPVSDEVLPEDDGEDVVEEKQSALNFLFSRLSYILRRESSPPRAPVLIPKTSALQLLSMLVAKLDGPVLIPSLPVLLLPLHNLTDKSIPIPYTTDELFKSGYEAIRNECHEIMESLKLKCGTSIYTEQLLQVRRGVRERREMRSSKRKIDAVTAPERSAKDKIKKVERKKERRKERGAEHRDARNAY